MILIDGSQGSDLYLLCDVYSIGSWVYEDGCDVVTISSLDVESIRELLSVDDETTGRPSFHYMLQAVLAYIDSNSQPAYEFLSENYRPTKEALEGLEAILKRNAQVGSQSMGASLSKLANEIESVVKEATQREAPSDWHMSLSLSACLVTDNEVLARVSTLRSCGFADAGSFEIDQMPGVVIWCMANEKGSMMAIVYRHQQQGVWTDVLVPFENGGYLTVANLSFPASLDEQPGVRKFYEPHATEVELVAFCNKEAGRTPRRRVRKEEVASFFERAYREEMEWRSGRGGVSEAELRRFASANGQELDPLEMLVTRSAIQFESEAAIQAAVFAAIDADLGEDPGWWAENSIVIHPGTGCIRARLSILELLDGKGLSDVAVGELEAALLKIEESATMCVDAANQLLPAQYQLKNVVLGPGAPGGASLFVLPRR